MENTSTNGLSNAERKELFYAAMEDYNIINPLLTFDGEYAFSDSLIWANDENINESCLYDKDKDILHLNSIIDKDGNNLYDLFIKKYFYSHFVDNIPKEIVHTFNPFLINRMNKDGKGRHLAYDYKLTILNLAEKKGIFKGYEDSTLDMIDILRQYYIEQRKLFFDYQRNGFNSSSYKELASRFIKNNNLPIEGNIPNDQEAKAALLRVNTATIDRYIEVFTSIIFSLKYLKEYLSSNPEQHLNEVKFKECFDKDKFYLMYMKAIMNFQEHTIRETGEVDSSMVLVTNYLRFIRDFDLIGYNPVIKCYDRKSNKLINYTIEDLKREYEELNDKYHFRDGEYQVSNDTIKKLNIDHDNDAYERLQRISSNNEDNQAVLKYWKPLPSGTMEVVNVRPIFKREGSNDKKITTEEDISYRKIAIESTDYEVKLVGMDKFSGYIGYLYKNGLVLFEKYYEEDYTPAQESSTYIMNYHNFADMCQLTKPEIMEYIRSTSNPDVVRKYHTENWAQNIRDIIDKVKANPQTEFEVSMLVDHIKATNDIKR